MGKASKLAPLDTRWAADVMRCQRLAGRALEERRALEVLAADPRVFYEKARLEANSGQHRKAIEYLNRALEIWKDADPIFEPARGILVA